LLERFAGAVSTDEGGPLEAVDGYVIMTGEAHPAPRRWAGVVLVAGATGSEGTHRYALSVGAAAVVHPAMAPEDLSVVWAAVLAGDYPLPLGIARSMARRLAQPPRQLVLSERDMIIVGGLSRGDTMAAIADRLGCSERHARRHTRSLWDTLGVANRAQGLVAAARWGLLD